MAARRRLADTLLLNWIVTLSLLLILLGLVTFVVFLTDPRADRWSEAGKLIGATLFQVGAVTLLLELVHLERLLGSKVPEALLDHGYLDNLKDDRLDDLIERVIRARFSGVSPDDARLGRDWLLQSLSAPSRRDYTVTLELRRNDAVAEPVPDAAPVGDGVLCVQITYEYVTDLNATDKPVLINGNGVVQAYRNTIPDALEFARRFRAGELTGRRAGLGRGDGAAADRAALRVGRRAAGGARRDRQPGGDQWRRGPAAAGLRRQVRPPGAAR
jgi:hypothetical protein